MKKITLLLLLLLVITSICVTASVDKIAIYNPFTRSNMQWISTGFNGALTKDIIWDATATTTTLNTSMGGSTNLTNASTLYLVDNLTALKFPSSGVLIIGTEAIAYYNFTVGTNLSADNVTSVTIEKRAAYGSSNASHTAADSVYFSRFLVGTDNSTAPWFSINSNGYTGFGSITPSNMVTINGNLTVDMVNTGQGMNELYDMDQNVLTTSNVTFDVMTSTESRGATNWTYLQNYPSACPDGSAVTTLDDSVTCTEFALLDSASNAGNLNLTGYNSTTYQSTMTNLEADNLESHLDGTGYNITIQCIIFESGGLICSS